LFHLFGYLVHVDALCFLHPPEFVVFLPNAGRENLFYFPASFTCGFRYEFAYSSCIRVCTICCPVAECPYLPAFAELALMLIFCLEHRPPRRLGVFDSWELGICGFDAYAFLPDCKCFLEEPLW
jgi:hypothetical protein